MGSFVALELEMTFVPETPPEVLAAFAAHRTRQDAPVLATLEELLGSVEYERLELALEDYVSLSLSVEDANGLDGVPLAHRAMLWRAIVQWGENAYIKGPVYTSMHWDQLDGVWSLATRTLPKGGTQEVEAVIGPLGEFALDGTPRHPTQVGTITDESGLPTSVWSLSRAPFQFS